VLAPKLFGGLNVARLRVFQAPSKQMNDVSLESEINAIAGAKIHPDLRDALPNRLNVTEIPVLNTVDACTDTSPRHWIECVQPLVDRNPVVIGVAPQYLERDRK